jgi:hypothetical protein
MPKLKPSSKFIASLIRQGFSAANKKELKNNKNERSSRAKVVPIFLLPNELIQLPSCL